MKKLLLVVGVLMSFSLISAQSIRVGSYNVRYANDGDAKNGNGWEKRCPVQLQLINFYNFDVLGTQEVLHPQLLDLTEGLPQYGYVGVGRDDGKEAGEYAPIFYKKEKIECLASGHFWMSENTTYPNTGWDAALPRICTWAQLKDKATGTVFWFLNLHMDHVGVVARNKSAELVVKVIKEMCNGDPVILTGDFNVDQTHENYRILHDSGILKDSYETADIKYALNGTFNAFNLNLKTDSRIDHIFVSSSFKVYKYGVLTDTYRSSSKKSKIVREGDFPKEVFFEESEARLPSDHFPILVDLTF